MQPVHSRPLSRPARAAAMLGACLVAFAACGGDDDDSNVGTPDSGMAADVDAVGGGALYLLSTCSFVGDTGDCDPIAIPDGAAEFLELNFALINPGTGPGCAGSLDLSLNGRGSGPGRMAWEVQELEATTCRSVGERITGSRDLAPMFVEDVYLPIGNFTFRMQVEQQ